MCGICGAISAVCCACQSIQTLASCCRCGKRSTRARSNYFVMFILVAVLAWVLKDYGYAGLKHVGDMKNCADEDCTGKGIVLRMTLAMVLLTSLVCILVCGVSSGSDPRAQFQNDFFFVKWVLLLIAIVGLLFMSNESAVQYGYVAAVGGGGFLLIGMLLVLEFAYGWNDSWVERYDTSGEKIWAFGIVSAAVVCYGLSVTVWALLFVYFGGDGCDETTAAVIVTIVLSVFVTLLTLPDKVQQGAILPCGVVVLYCTWLCASAVLSMPIDENSQCVARHTRVSSGTAHFMRAVGVIFTIFCVGYATVRAASTGQELSVKQTRPSTELLDSEKGEEVTAEAEEDEEDSTQYSYTFFQVVYALGAMYLAMVLIDWEIAIHTKNSSLLGNESPWAHVWIKLGTQWGTFLLYTWTLIAPLVCTDREFFE